MFLLFQYGFTGCQPLYVCCSRARKHKLNKSGLKIIIQALRKLHINALWLPCNVDCEICCIIRIPLHYSYPCSSSFFLYLSTSFIIMFHILLWGIFSFILVMHALLCALQRFPLVCTVFNDLVSLFSSSILFPSVWSPGGER